MLDQLFDNRLYPTGLDFTRVDGYPDARGCILLVPGRYWHDRMPEIECDVASYEWLLLVRTSDEEDLFDVRQFAGPERTKFWVQTPMVTRDYGDARLFGVGYSPAFINLPEDPPAASLDVFLMAQNNHARRNLFFAALPNDRPWWVVSPTGGFTQGLSPEGYAATMTHTKVAPAPVGPYTPDTFRVYEALEAHAVPIADDGDRQPGEYYWRMIFPDAPLPILRNIEDLPGYIDDQLALWPANANRLAAYWMRYKRQMAHNLVSDLKELGAI